MMYYIYEIKNNINNKTYIGQRKCPEGFVKGRLNGGRK